MLKTLSLASLVLLGAAAFQSGNQQGSDSPSSQIPTFRTEVSEVVVYVAVYDQKGQLVTGLGRDNFEVYEDRVAQQISTFSQVDVPSTIGIIMDRSGSMRNKMGMVNEATRLFLEQNNPANELFLISFNDQVELEEDLTSDLDDIRDALDNLIISGGTALYDAIYLGLDHAREGNLPRKALVVFTDGEDKDSYYKLQELVEKVEESEAQVFIVAFLDAELSDEGGFFGVFKSQRDKVQKRIESIAEASGGKAFFPQDVSQLQQSFQDIASDLRNQYRITYVSSNPTRDGKWRRIDVRLRGPQTQGLKVRAKKGYFAK